MSRIIDSFANDGITEFISISKTNACTYIIRGNYLYKITVSRRNESNDDSLVLIKDNKIVKNTFRKSENIEYHYSHNMYIDISFEGKAPLIKDVDWTNPEWEKIVPLSDNIQFGEKFISDDLITELNKYMKWKKYVGFWGDAHVNTWLDSQIDVILRNLVNKHRKNDVANNIAKINNNNQGLIGLFNIACEAYDKRANESSTIVQEKIASEEFGPAVNKYIEEYKKMLVGKKKDFLSIIKVIEDIYNSIRDMNDESNIFDTLDKYKYFWAGDGLHFCVIYVDNMDGKIYKYNSLNINDLGILGKIYIVEEGKDDRGALSQWSNECGIMVLAFMHAFIATYNTSNNTSASHEDIMEEWKKYGLHGDSTSTSRKNAIYGTLAAIGELYQHDYGILPEAANKYICAKLFAQRIDKKLNNDRHEYDNESKKYWGDLTEKKRN